MIDMDLETHLTPTLSPSGEGEDAAVSVDGPPSPQPSPQGEGGENKPDAFQHHVPTSDEPKFRAGDRVDCVLWDMTVRPQDRLGIQVVEGVLTGEACESGVMIVLEGYPSALDQNWLKAVKDVQQELGNL